MIEDLYYKDMEIHNSKVELLRKVNIFSRLPEYELDVIARYSEFVDFNRGDNIFSNGSPADALYVVKEGQVGIISVQDKDKADVAIAQIVAGESFGELDLLGRSGRSAAAFAEGNSTLLKFPATPYTSFGIFQDHPYISARMLYRLLGIISDRIWHVNKMIYDKTPWLQDLHKQLLCDKMTGLFNQNYLKEDFINLIPDIGKGLALIMIKPDNFKFINDRFGHETGDHVLNILAIFLQSELRENDIGVRYRGDEYAAILIDSSKSDAIARAKEIASAYKNMDLSEMLGTDSVKISVSMGIALFPGNADNSKDLVSEAHRKLYRARDLGGNRAVV